MKGVLGHNSAVQGYTGPGTTWVHDRGHLWYTGSVLDCWLTGQAIDRAPGACFKTKFSSLAQVVPGPI